MDDRCKWSCLNDLIEPRNVSYLLLLLISSHHIMQTCFFRQFGKSVVRADYLTLRRGFILVCHDILFISDVGFARLKSIIGFAWKEKTSPFSLAYGGKPAFQLESIDAHLPFAFPSFEEQ